MVQGNRYEGLKNDEIKKLQESIIPYTSTEININSFNVELIQERKNNIAYRLRNMLSCNEELVTEAVLV